MEALFWFTIIITPVVFIHEFGHFLFARFFAVKIDIFSVGFGKPLLKWRDSKDTTWQIAIIPLGGYVKMYGDQEIAPNTKKLQALIEKEKKMSFYYKKLWQKALIVFGGPFANYTLTMAIFIFITLYSGIRDHKTEITEVQIDSPAQKAGLQIGDTIVDLNNNKVNSFIDLKSELALSLSDEMTIGYIRKNTYFQANIISVNMEVKNITGELIKQRIIGASFEKFSYKKVGFLKSISYSAEQTIDISYTMLKAIWQMITGKRSTDDIGGPIKIAKYSAKIAGQGFIAILFLLAMISLNLGLVNLLPVPMLDGGHLFYYAIETIIRRPINYRVQNIGFKIGLVILISMMGIAFWNDLKSIIFLNSLRQIIFN